MKAIAGWALAGLVLLGLHSSLASADPGDCIGESDDGRRHCGSMKVKPFLYGLCDENAPAFWREQAMCRAMGGTPGPNGTCPGSTPHTEDNVASRAVDYAHHLTGEDCSLASDSGWDVVYGSYWCGDFNGPTYTEGHLTFTGRRIVASCETFGAVPSMAIKQRGLECPLPYTLFSTTHGPRCGLPLEKCDGCESEGNPVSPGTGTKLQTETDYVHPQGLELRRFYHSNRFYEPYTQTPGALPENQFEAAWRSNYDKRVVPLGRPYAAAALTLPDGRLQFFDAAGDEVLNYRGARGRLVTAAEGYYYLGPDEVEFYGTDGRLRKISRRTGEVLDLVYSDGTTGPGGAYALDAAGSPTTLPVPAGRLLHVTDASGNALSFGYNHGGRVVLMTDPAGGVYLYSYDATGNLASVRYPDLSTRSYRYNESANVASGASLPFALTSVVDENGTVFGTYKYDANGRATLTEHAGGAQRYELAYNTDGTTSVTDALGTTRTQRRVDADGILRFAGTSQPGGAGFSAGVQDRTFDAKGNILSQTDFNGVKTCYAYDAARNVEITRVEGVPAGTGCAAVTTPGASLPAGSRKIETEWHPRWRVPARLSEPGRRTTFAYNGDSGAACAPSGAVIADGSASGQPIGVLCSRTVQATTDIESGAQGFNAGLVGAPRAWTYAYNARGKVLSVDGPRTDVNDLTTYTYYADDDAEPAKRGNLATVLNAASHLTSFTAYNGHGQPTTVIDANGMTTTLAYDARRRLLSRNAGGELTAYEYDAAGQLKKVTLPDGSHLAYDYDAAHRLVGVSDNLGNRISYTLDGMGNRTLEEVRDPSNVLAQKRTRVYNALNRLFRELGAQDQTTEYGYDSQGNLTSVKDPLDRVTSNQYDALNRLKQVTDPGLGVTQYAYNGLDALTQVTDPRGLATSYTVDGLGNLTLQASPDTGNTAKTYDAAGNLLTQTDAKSQLTTYAYDALNRVTLITFHDGSKQAHQYDQGANGVGRLGSITETDPADQVVRSISYTYDAHGRVASDSRTVGGTQYATAYAYDSAGRLSSIGYPGGRAVAYSYDPLGRVRQIVATKGSVSQVVVQDVHYHPFGGVRSYTLGNGQSYSRSIDLDGRIASYTLGAKTFGIGYDAASRIEFISEAGVPANTNTYTYDALDRLTGASTPGTPYAYTYDPVGNRLSRTVGSATETLAYGATSNRIASLTPASGPPRGFVFDPNGSTTNDGNNTYAYDVRGRMVQATSAAGTAAYEVNALGQRVRKTTPTGDTVFHYDTGGRLIAETSPSGVVTREYFYLGDIPVAVVVPQ